MRKKRAAFTAVILSLSALLLAAGLFCLCVNLYMVAYARPYVYKDVDSLPYKYTVILPGARVYQSTVSHVVADRIEGTLRCINAGKAEHILVSGDHGRKDYDEVNQILAYMRRVYGTDEGIVFLDHAGFSTYETAYRARDVFCVTDAIIVTQKFHTYRAVYIARKLGLDAVALEAPELFSYADRTRASWAVRETLARVKAFFDVARSAKPTYLGEQIPITGDPAASRD
ncbi:MAG: YdcF family protein [Treponema sp.]|nr:YdcF family protein [Treponema sp.]